MPSSSSGLGSEHPGRRVRTIFLSSTAEDLAEHRAKVAESIDRLELRVDGMESFGARPTLPLDECRRRAAKADALVVCVANRYGWVPPKDEAKGVDGTKSITWYEVEAAEQAGKPVFAFLLDPKREWSGPEEQDRLKLAKTAEEADSIREAVAHLESFKAILSTKVRAYFSTPDDLAGKVGTSLANWLLEQAAEDSAEEDTPPVAPAVSASPRIDLPTADTFTYRRVMLHFKPGKAGHYPIELTDGPSADLLRASLHFEPAGLETLLWSSSAPVRGARTNVEATLPSLESAKQVGAALYEALLGSQVGDHLRQLGRQVNPQKREGLRFVLDATDVPEIARLPWEFAYHQAERSFVFTAIHTPLARWLNLDQPVPTLQVEPPLKVLFAVANPRGALGELAVGEELSHLDRELADLAEAGGVKVTRLEHATFDSLNDALDHDRPHILHFIGHGNSEGESGFLFLEDDELSGAQLAELLKNHSHHLRLVFLNSCLGATGSTANPFGGVAQWIVRRGIPAVVAMQFPITDKGAVVLAREFYSRLGAGSAVDAALAAARNVLSIKHNKTAEWGAPVLYMQAPDGRLFDIRGTAAEGVDDAPPLLPAQPPTVPPASGRAGWIGDLWRWARWGLYAGLVALLLLVTAIVLTAVRVPQAGITAARTALDEAQRAEAATYAPDSFVIAERAWKQANTELESQQLKLQKDFTKTKELLSETRTAAERAAAAAVAGKAKAKDDASAGLSAAQAALFGAEQGVAGAPKTKDRAADVEAMQADIETLKGVLAEAQSAFDSEDYIWASQQAGVVSDEAASIQNDITQAMR